LFPTFIQSFIRNKGVIYFRLSLDFNSSIFSSLHPTYFLFQLIGFRFINQIQESVKRVKMKKKLKIKCKQKAKKEVQ